MLLAPVTALFNSGSHSSLFDGVTPSEEVDPLAGGSEFLFHLPFGYIIPRKKIIRTILLFALKDAVNAGAGAGYPRQEQCRYLVKGLEVYF